MITTVQTTFLNMAPSEALAERIREEAEKLNRVFDRITSCDVTVEAPHRHHRSGEAFHIHIKLGVPGKELVVAHEPALWTASKHEDKGDSQKAQDVDALHKDAYVAVRDSFEAMRRQLHDYVSRLRHDEKAH